jgi:hypothetical protein
LSEPEAREAAPAEAADKDAQSERSERKGSTVSDRPAVVRPSTDGLIALGEADVDSVALDEDDGSDAEPTAD